MVKSYAFVQFFNANIFNNYKLNKYSMEIISYFAREIRRASILTRKRLDYFKYNVEMKRSQKSVYNPIEDVYMMQE